MTMFREESNKKIQFKLELKNTNLNGANINSVKDFYVVNSSSNRHNLLKWWKHLQLLPVKYISENDFEISMYSEYGSLQLLSDIIQQHFDKISPKNKISLAIILENFMISDNPNLIEYTEELHPGKNLVISEIKTIDRLPTNKSRVPAYEMRTKNRGTLFFVNIIHFPQSTNENRLGSEHDKFYMISLFRAFGYTIFYYENLLLDTFLSVLNKLKRSYLDETESLVFIVSSHGREQQDIEFYLGESLEFHDILLRFNNQSCSTMVGKPKIFIFPCCRGKMSDFGIRQISKQTCLESDGLTNLSTYYSDIIICYATLPGFVAKRCVENGNYYIEALYRVLAEKACEMDFESMLFMVAQKLQEICELSNLPMLQMDPEHKTTLQTPSCVRWDFNKLLYFNPGYIE